jgi:hypothetical protein
MSSQSFPTDNHANLGFIDKVLSSFKFLINVYGFRCVKIEPTLIRYESNYIFINIYHGRSSFELGVEIGKLEKVFGLQENWYTIGEIMDLMGVRDTLGFTIFQASTCDRMQMLVPKLAEYVREYAKSIFEGNLHIFEELRELRHRKSNEYIKEMNLGRIREIAEKAWHEKDYIKMIEIYTSMKDDLTSVESKKLAYAQKRLRTD